eukprot:5790658-Ditylum_brightwellii.AAC.1
MGSIQTTSCNKKKRQNRLHPFHYIILELLKNSIHGTVDWYGVNANYLPIRVVIFVGWENEDVVIKVSNEGRANPTVHEGIVAFQEHNNHTVDLPLAGLGYGLL